MMEQLRGAVRIIPFFLLPAPLSAQSVGPLGKYVTIHGTIALEESDSVLTVAPIVVPDPFGGFLVADAREAQVRLYDERGRVKKLVARPGSGPREVRVPTAVVRRLADGHILVADVLAGAILEFDSAGSNELRRYPVSFPISGLLDLGDALLTSGVPGTTRGGEPPMLLQFWDGTFDRGGFFPLPAVRVAPAVARTYGYTTATVSGDEIFAAYALSDTLYVFSRSGEPVEKIGLNLNYWSLPTTPPVGAPRSPARRAWEEQLTRISDVYVVGDRILVQYVGEKDGELVWRLACITRDGQKLFDLDDTPRLLTVVGDRLYFVDAGSLTDDRWVVVSLR
ncbi:MAG TPA: hypothetical protein VF158_04115 [Longimicrobiales bacterium]